MNLSSTFNVAFISSALSPEKEEGYESFDFFAVLLGGIVIHAQKNLIDGRVAVYVPEKIETDRTNQGDLLQKVLKLGRRFDAIVIAPFETSVVKAELLKYVNSISSDPEHDDASDIPLVFIDKNIDPEELGEDVCNRFSIVNVACDNHDGGRKAARLLIKALNAQDIVRNRKRENRPSRFMILRGLEGGEQRANGFREAIASATRAEIITPASDDLNFTRSGARRWMEDQLASIREKKINDFGSLGDTTQWGIFACNDEMALGIHAVISARHDLLRERVGLANDESRVDSETAEDVSELMFLQGIKIVGFDGIGAAREVISPMRGVRDRWFVGTIGAQVERQSASAIDWIKKLRESPALKSDRLKSVLGIREFPSEV
jgi:ABC-type sugar transport system substrate-binding protein